MSNPIVTSFGSSGHIDIMDRVLGLVAKYKAIKEPGQALREIRQKTSVRGLLHDLIRHQVKVILGRPESIEDGFVTVYDRALVIITQSGRVVNTIAAEELYIAAFVGVDPHMPGGMVDEVIEKHIALKSLLIKLDTGHALSSDTSDAGHNVEHAYIALAKSEAEDQADAARIQDDTSLDEKLRRIVNVYLKAKRDFKDIDDGDYAEKASAARFLRDSAENALSCLQARGLDSHWLIPELEVIFVYARDRAAQLLGGKKRRFELHGDQPDGSAKRLRGSDCYRPQYSASYWRP